MNTLNVKQKLCIELVMIITLLVILDIILTTIFLSLGGDEYNSWLFFSQFLELNHFAGMLYLISFKALGILILLKLILMLKEVPQWIFVTLLFAIFYYVFFNLYSLDFIYFIKFGNSFIY